MDKLLDILGLARTGHHLCCISIHIQLPCTTIVDSTILFIRLLKVIFLYGAPLGARVGMLFMIILLFNLQDIVTLLLLKIFGFLIGKNGILPLFTLFSNNLLLLLLCRLILFKRTVHIFCVGTLPLMVFVLLNLLISCVCRIFMPILDLHLLRFLCRSRIF